MSDSDNYDDQRPTNAGIDSAGNTHFHPSDAPADQKRKYRRMWRYNEDLQRDRNHANTSEIRRRTNNHTLDAIAGQLGIPDFQKEEVEIVMETENFGEMQCGPWLNYSIYCFAVVIVVWNRYHEHLQEKFIVGAGNLEHFDQMQSELDITDRQLEQALEELDYSLGEYA